MQYGVNRAGLVLATTTIVALLFSACGASTTPVSTPTNTAVANSDRTAQPISTPMPSPAEPGPSPSPTVILIGEPDKQREIGDVDGITFIVGEGSEATFTVEEKLARLPLPSDAVIRTTALSGEVHLDGRPSVIKIELHKLESDQARRDRYIRSRMFPSHSHATFTI